MVELCEVCGKKPHSKLCDYEVGTGIVTSIGFKEITKTCDKKLCKGCSVEIWGNCDICPEHAEELKIKLNNQK